MSTNLLEEMAGQKPTCEFNSRKGTSEARFQGFKVSKFQGFKVSKSQGFEV
jgi:hypothetical protein